MSSWSRTQAVFIKFLFLIDSFVQLKINNQALETAFAPVSPGEVFKVFGSDKSIKHNQHNNMFIFFTSVIFDHGSTDDYAKSKQDGISILYYGYTYYTSI